LSTMEKDKKSEAEILRQKAEELIGKKPLESGSKLSEADALRLIHELEVHRVELELQNEELAEAKEQAENNAEKYTELYDFAPLGYFTLSKEGKIIELNFSGGKMLGQERSLLKNKIFRFFVSEETRPLFNDFLRKVFESKIKEACDVISANDVNSPLHIHITGIAAENREQCFMTVVDITERKIAEESLLRSEQNFKSLAESMPQIVWVTRADGWNIYFNQQWVDYTGLTLEGSYGHGWNIPFHPDDKQRAWDAWQNATKNNAVYSLNCRLRRADGAYKWWLIRGVPLIDESGKILKWYGTCTDIEDIMQTKEELILAKERAEESDRLKSAFLANMSHEIRTPMNGILGFADLLKEPNLTGEEQKKYIGIIEKSGVRMLNIINDIIDISKIESGQMEVSISEIDINEKIEYIYTFFKPEAEGKGIQINFKNTLPSKESVIKTDREKIYSILTNLIKNAIKYTNEGSIEFGYTLKRNYIEFYVKDTGIGIPKDRQEAIFERFIQADISDIRALQGAGLGLAIAKAYTEMLGGKIWVESEEGKGSIFYFTIPYNTAELFKKFCGEEDKNEIKNIVLDEGEAKEYFGEIKDLKILIAEDVEPSDMLITIAINKITKEVLHAKTGIEAVEACRNNPDIDVVLMDIKMPEMDGYEATRLIRKFNKNIIIIAQTAQALTGDREKAITAGCNDYISKPIIISKLMAMIKKCV